MFDKIKFKIRRGLSKRKYQKKFPKRGKSSSRWNLARSFDEYRNGFILFLIAILFLGLFIWTLFGVVKFIQLDIKGAYRDEKNGQNFEWNGEGRINIILIGLDRRENEFAYVDSIEVVVLDPIDESLGIFNVNVDTAVYVAEKNKYEKLQNLYSYGVLEKDLIPVELVTSEVESLLSIKIDRYVLMYEGGLSSLVDGIGGVNVSNEELLKDKNLTLKGKAFVLKPGNVRLGGEDFLSFVRADDDGNDNKLQRQIEATKGLLRRLTSYIAFLKLPKIVDVVEENLYTDMSKGEILRLLQTMSGIKEINSSLQSEDSLTDTSFVYGDFSVPIFDKLDQDIQGVFMDKSIGKEQARVEIFNSTDVSGLASFRARWLKNIGIDVIRVGDTAEVYEKTTIFCLDEAKHSYTIDAIVKTFDEEIEISDTKPNFVSTGDVVIVIGDNVKEYL